MSNKWIRLDKSTEDGPLIFRAVSSSSRVFASVVAKTPLLGLGVLFLLSCTLLECLNWLNSVSYLEDVTECVHVTVPLHVLWLKSKDTGERAQILS